MMEALVDLCMVAAVPGVGMPGGVCSLPRPGPCARHFLSLIPKFIPSL